MCQGEIPVRALERRHAVDFPAYFAAALAQLAPLEADGLVRIGPDRIVATTQGRLLLRNIAMCFDRYLAPQTGLNQATDAAPRFSRAI
jgi:oxygen-independent coproporphyrinogen-3 oxidase